jgi:HPt (histidine-containing phosphotransfer) domain-containing protein
VTAPVIDAATFAELQASAGADFVGELVATFLEEAPIMLAELKSALAADQAEPFRRAAHSLKSNAHTFGAAALGATARELELGGLAAAKAPGALDRLDQEYARAAAALSELRRG